jgi:hypothetical protein
MRFLTSFGLFACLAAPVAASESASANLIVSATFFSRTSLTVSTKILQFQVTEPGVPATASVEFSARARTQPGSEVVLAVETAKTATANRTAKAKAGPASMDVIAFNGDGEGTSAGMLGSASPTVAGRWVGSGAREGRLIFTLYATDAGNYSVPVQFVLSAP